MNSNCPAPLPGTATTGHRRFVNSQVALFYAGSESTRTNLVYSLMRMRTLDICIQRHLHEAESSRREFDLMPVRSAAVNTELETKPPSRTHRTPAKRRRCHDAVSSTSQHPDCSTGIRGDATESAQLRQHLRERIAFHCNAAAALSLERKGLADNATHCAQDIYLMWKLRCATLERALLLHNSS
jgi:hypothetical protein